MSADHRKPVVAFVALLFLAALIVAVQRADALGAGFTGLAGGSAPAHGDLPGADAEDFRTRLGAVAPGYFGQRGRTEEQQEGRRSGSEPPNRGGHAKRPAVSRRDSALARVLDKTTDARRHDPGLPGADAPAPLPGAQHVARRAVTRTRVVAKPVGHGPVAGRSGVVPLRLVREGPRHGDAPRAR